MIYLLLWYALIGSTLAVGVAGLFWGIKNGQFEDQDRVRYFPLRDPSALDENLRPDRRPFELLVLTGCGVLMLVAMTATILLSLKTLF